MERGATTAVAAAVLFVGCGGGDDGSAGSSGSAPDDRFLFHDEEAGVRAVVADCFVVEVDGTRHLRTTVEVHNGSDAARRVIVTVSSTAGVDSDSAAVEVPAGASDAWAVTSRETTDAPRGAVECVDAVASVAVAVEQVNG